MAEEQKAAAAPPAGEAPPEGEQPARAFHILIKHAESRNPTSYRTSESTASLSKADAHKELEGIHQKLTTKIDEGIEPMALIEAFKEEATARSDCGSFRNGGDLGALFQSKMPPGTESLAPVIFSCAPIHLTGIVDTQSGSHIILRTL
eukprot:gnl/MRDRNA2_/MRDRNA2_114165_c0_seq1.p1 gnl/MRDRNA2_/MRDRNA2_114165_c0~~gnl/MRDRNA2_/MRDRNA2_114165_c0_seq1.p1  ORF type:complete len:148 (+),score=34.07 gnl/MRDRNA2_/MRDRNA2_114165_c0_seq1:94-537(+)